MGGSRRRPACAGGDRPKSSPRTRRPVALHPARAGVDRARERSEGPDQPPPRTRGWTRRGAGGSPECAGFPAHAGIDLRVPWSPTQQSVRPAPAGNPPGTDRNWQVVASWPCSGSSRIWRRHGWARSRGPGAPDEDAASERYEGADRLRRTAAAVNTDDVIGQLNSSIELSANLTDVRLSPSDLSGDASLAQVSPRATGELDGTALARHERACPRAREIMNPANIQLVVSCAGPPRAGGDAPGAQRAENRSQGNAPRARG